MKKSFLFSILFLSAIASAQVPTYVPLDNLVGWWPFNGNGNDESGAGNHGTVSGAVLTADRFGNLNNAYNFDGIDDFISGIVDNSNINDVSYSVWVNCPNITGGTFIHLGSDNGSPFCNGMSFGNFSAPNTNLVGHFSCIGFFNSITNFTPNQWEFCTLVKESNLLKFYINGQNISQIPTSGFNSPDNHFWFGSTFSNYLGFYKGTLDDIGIWNRALTDCEIQNLYQAQLGFTTLNAGADQDVCNGTEVILNGTGGSNLTWNNGVTNGVSFVPTQTSNYILTGADSLGCVGVDTVLVMVNAPTTSSQTQVALDTYTWPVNNQTYTQSGIYTDTLVNAAGCDSIVTLNLSMEYTGLLDAKQLSASISPNPVKDQFVLHGATNITALNLLDVQGKLVQTFDVQQDEFSLSNLKPGMYFLELQQGNQCNVFKVMKE